MPTGPNIQIGGVGVIQLNDHIAITNVLYIPEFWINLLSVSQLTKDLKLRVYFDEDSCVIHDHTRALMIGHDKQVAGLYVLEAASLLNTSLTAPVISCNSVVVDGTLWHSRLGHPSYSKIDVLNNVLCLKQRYKDSSIHRDICQKAKQKRLLFPSHNNISSALFDLVHIDTWGPFSVPSVDDFRYFLTIVEDHSRATWVYMMKTKDEVLRIFPEYLKFVETQYQQQVG